MDHRRGTDVAIALVVGRLQSVIQIFASILICLTLIRDFFFGWYSYSTSGKMESRFDRRIKMCIMMTRCHVAWVGPRFAVRHEDNVVWCSFFVAVLFYVEKSINILFQSLWLRRLWQGQDAIPVWRMAKNLKMENIKRATILEAEVNPALTAIRGLKGDGKIFTIALMGKWLNM